MRPTGRLHLGNYYGALRNWVELQYQYECFFFVADWHMLTTGYDDTGQLQEHVREVLIEALEAEGCEVVSAESGEIALALFDQDGGRFDALFTDIGMPSMNGWELVTEIRQRSETIPIAIISGWADAISVQTRNAVKADWVVAKPFDIDRISRIAQEIAERRTALVGQALTLRS